MRYTEAPARRAELLRRLSRDGYVSSQDLAANLGVSEMTIRRDLARLDAEGLAHRVLGGAHLPETSATGEPFERRSRAGTSEKRAIALACVAFLDGATTIALDAGSTAGALASTLPPGSTVVTHSVPVIAVCSARDDLELIGLGGTYQVATRSFAGPATRAALGGLAVDAAILSATALDRHGLYSASALDAEIKQGMRRIARRVVLLVDHSKIGPTAPIRFGDLADVDVAITDSGASEEQLTLLRAAIPKVLIAPVHGASSGPSA